MLQSRFNCVSSESCRKIVAAAEKLMTLCRLHGLIELFGPTRPRNVTELYFIIALSYLLPLTFPAFFNLFIACYKSVFCDSINTPTYAPFVPIIAFPGIMSELLLPCFNCVAKLNKCWPRSMYIVIALLFLDFKCCWHIVCVCVFGA